MKKTLLRYRRIVIGVICLILFLVACSGPSYTYPIQFGVKDDPTNTSAVASATAIPNATMTPSCEAASPVAAGTSADMTIASDPRISKGATTRTYRLHIPTDYQPQIALPLLLIFHGRGSNAAEIESYTTFSQLADQERFVTVYPQGLKNSSGETFWDSFSPTTEGVDELAFVKNVLDDVEQELCVDRNRIYAVGFSNGGNMTGMLACRMADRIAAFAPIAGNFFDLQQGCHPDRAVAILNAHGTADDIVPYDTQPPHEGQPWERPGVQEWLQGWAKQDSCTNGPLSFSHVSNVTGMQWTDCHGDVVVTHYRIEGGKHVWPKTLGHLPTRDAIWHFLLAYPLPQVKSAYNF